MSDHLSADAASMNGVVNGASSIPRTRARTRATKKNAPVAPALRQQILVLLKGKGLGSKALATATGAKLSLVCSELTKLHRAHLVDRSGKPFVYTLAKPGAQKKAVVKPEHVRSARAASAARARPAALPAVEAAPADLTDVSGISPERLRSLADELDAVASVIEAMERFFPASAA